MKSKKRKADAEAAKTVPDAVGSSKKSETTEATAAAGDGNNANGGSGSGSEGNDSNIKNENGGGNCAGQGGDGAEANGENVGGEKDAAEKLAELHAKQLSEAEARGQEYLDRWQRCAAEFENYKRRTRNEMDRLYASSAADTIAVFLPVVDSIERATGQVVAPEAQGAQAAEAKTGADADANADANVNAAANADVNAATNADVNAKADSNVRADVDANASGGGSAGSGGAAEACASGESKADPYRDGLILIGKQINDVLKKLDVKPLPGVGEQFDPNLHEAVMHTEDASLGANVVAEVFQKGYMYKDKIVRHSVVRVAN